MTTRHLLDYHPELHIYALLILFSASSNIIVFIPFMLMTIVRAESVYVHRPFLAHLRLWPGRGYKLNLVVHELDVGPEAEDLEDGVGAVVGRLAGEEVVGDAHRRVRQPQEHPPRWLVENRLEEGNIGIIGSDWIS